MWRRGLPHLSEVFDSVQKIIKGSKRETPFKDGRPWRDWFKVRYFHSKQNNIVAFIKKLTVTLNYALLTLAMFNSTYILEQS